MSSDNEYKAIVKVNYGSGQEDVTHIGAIDFQILDGHLRLESARGAIAAYAPGKWLSVKLLQPTA